MELVMIAVSKMMYCCMHAGHFRKMLYFFVIGYICIRRQRLVISII